jgi:hypothetical protein
LVSDDHGQEMESLMSVGLSSAVSSTVCGIDHICATLSKHKRSGECIWTCR